MAELESVLFTNELEISGDKNKHASNRTRKLAINGDDEMLALLKNRAIKELEQTFPDEVESYRKIRALSAAVSYIYDFVGWISQQCKYLSMRFIMVGNNNP
uniref:Uncharacterized protein n=1 Tax=Populus trichocarpa TaxID=3694 RepID=A0A2K1ZLH9_POPTR